MRLWLLKQRRCIQYVTDVLVIAHLVPKMRLSALHTFRQVFGSNEPANQYTSHPGGKRCPSKGTDADA